MNKTNNTTIYKLTNLSKTQNDNIEEAKRNIEEAKYRQREQERSIISFNRELKEAKEDKKELFETIKILFGEKPTEDELWDKCGRQYTERAEEIDQWIRQCENILFECKVLIEMYDKEIASSESYIMLVENGVYAYTLEKFQESLNIFQEDIF